MKCANHPETEATDICPICRAPFCGECVLEISGQKYCKPCLEKKIGSPAAVRYRKSAFWALVFSLLPGAGYFYLGLMKRGLQMMVLFFGTIFLAEFISLGPLLGLIIPVSVFYSIFDTQQLLKRNNDGDPLEDREFVQWGSLQGRRNLFGGALIVLGLLALLNNMLPMYFHHYYTGRIIAPLVILSAGIYLLVRGGKGKEVNGNGGN